MKLAEAPQFAAISRSGEWLLCDRGLIRDGHVPGFVLNGDLGEKVYFDLRTRRGETREKSYKIVWWGKVPADVIDNYRLSNGYEDEIKIALNWIATEWKTRWTKWIKALFSFRLRIRFEVV